MAKKNKEEKVECMVCKRVLDPAKEDYYVDFDVAVHKYHHGVEEWYAEECEKRKKK